MAKDRMTFGVLRHRNYRHLLMSRILISVAVQAQAVIVGWQIYEITGDPFLLGLSGLAEAVPALFCSLFAGHAVDTRQPLTLYRLSLGILAANMILLFLLGGGIVTVAPKILLIVLYLAVFLSGVARSVIGPATFSLRSEIIPRAEMASGTALWSGGFQVAGIAGPAVAGLIYGGYGAAAAWFFALAMTLLALATALALQLAPLSRAEEKRLAALQSIREGWRYITKNQVLLSCMSLDMFAVLFGGAVAMLPAYAKEILDVGSEGLGILRAAPAIGAALTAVFLSIRPMKRLPATRLLWAVAGFGGSIVGFGLSQSFWLSVFFLVLSGAFDGVSMVVRGTIMQLLTPDHMRGRVSAVNSMFIFSSNEIGAFESGTAAKLLGLVPSVVFGGSFTALLSGLVAWRAPNLRRTVVNEKGEVEIAGEVQG